MLTPGTCVGPYEILDRLGEGGMGVVYRAADTTLGREVAIKTLPPSVTADPERLARLDREARTLASLNHPNIAQIYGIETFAEGPGGHGPLRALVMELVEGEDLAQRIARGPLPIDDALQIARQMADALAAAHDQRIVHRDLKPANVRIRPDGTVKVLDFGLAKALETKPSSAAAGVSQSPTLASPVAMTVAGTIVGTAAYMSPEQARGRSVDRRADVWAFGCVLYEMLTGRRPFDGSDVADVLAAVVRDAPAWEALPRDVPPPVRRLLRRCLEKESARRLDSLRDARLDLDESGEAAAITAPMPRRRSTGWLTAGALLAVPGLVLLGYVFGRGSTATAPPVVHAELSLVPAERLGPPFMLDRPTSQAFVLTSDGRRLVFAGQAGTMTQLYVRSLDAREAIPIPGTDGANTPFLSPDDQWIGFLADGFIRRVPIAGGPVVPVADLRSTDTASALITPGTDFIGASWGEDGTIVFGRYGDGLWRVSAAGGSASRWTTPDAGAHRLPRHLPGGRGVLLTVGRRAAGYGVAVLPSGETAPRLLIEDATDGRYVEPSYIVFARRGLLMAAPFDLERLEVTGTPFALEQDVMVAAGSGAPAANSGVVQVAVARSGTMVFANGGLHPATPRRLVWVDRSGGIEPIQMSADEFVRPRLSPDGRRIAVAARRASPAGSGGMGIHILDLERQAQTQLTRSQEWGPLWSADGSHVLFMQPGSLGRIRADGTGPIERLLDRTAYPHSITPDGSTLLFQTTGPDTGSNISLMPLDADRTPRPLLDSRANELWAEVSPDGKWLAYGSDSSGRFEVYVQSFPDLGPRHQISTGGGDSPLWSRSGRELFFMTSGDSPDTSRVNVVDVTTGSTFTSGRPRVLFSGRFGTTGGPTAYDISPDGRRFLMVENLDPPRQPVTRLHMVLNWFEELRRAQRMSR